MPPRRPLFCAVLVLACLSTGFAAPPDLTVPRRLIDESNAARAAGDHAIARAKAAEAVADLLARPEPEQDGAWLDHLEKAAFAAADAQDPTTASRAWQRTYAVRLATRPDDHPDLQRARHHLAWTLGQLGEIEPPGPAGGPALLRGTVWERGFSPLTHSGPEARGIGALYEEIHDGERPVIVLEKKKASRAALEELAPRARYLHVATHGWFAPESIRSWSDPAPIDTRSGLGSRPSGVEQVRGTSPMLLCGLALAGANLPEDALGRTPGLVTAEELSTLDLSNCELVVLSACDTNVGERRIGQGVASLQKALQMAGARSVITSLRKVPDEATKELMLDFYRRLWVEKKPKREALWEAKKKLRDAKDERGDPIYTTRDWAAWVLTGEPD